ncbi:MAG TPA: phospholipase A [Aquabacterium sp.]|nr:phospholipase A [Aquabacterium sp.]
MRTPRLSPTIWSALGLALLSPGLLAQTEAASAPPCAQEADAARRLACYDRLFPPAGWTPAAPPASDAPAAPTLAAAAPEAPVAPTSPLTTFWELDRASKRKAFVVRNYLPNFLLPVHVTTAINRAPHSPTRGVAPFQPNYLETEAKMQISLRTKVMEDLLLPGADLWFTYTQRSMWQVWNQADSAPFRSTDYQPEAVYVLPIARALGTLPGGWTWRMAQVGFAHQSNGQSEPLSRSWNRLYAGVALDKDDLALSLKVNRRPREGSRDDNPDLTHYIGNSELMASWFPGRATTALTWRFHPSYLNKGSLQLDWTYPVDSRVPDGLRWHVQLFSGFGETLLDYNHRQTSLGVGLSLFSF